MTDRYQVITHMDGEQYTRSQADEARDRTKGSTELTGFTRWTEKFYSERDIPRIVRDAARAAGRVPDDAPEPEWDMRRWPLEVKSQVMDAAHRTWEPEWTVCPGDPSQGSMWDAENALADAEDLLKTIPELMTALADEDRALRDMEERLTPAKQPTASKE